MCCMLRSFVEVVVGPSGEIPDHRALSCRRLNAGSEAASWKLEGPSSGTLALRFLACTSGTYLRTSNNITFYIISGVSQRMALYV